MAFITRALFIIHWNVQKVAIR